jgi:hypothetical protein
MSVHSGRVVVLLGLRYRFLPTWLPEYRDPSRVFAPVESRLQLRVGRLYCFCHKDLRLVRRGGLADPYATPCPASSRSTPPMDHRPRSCPVPRGGLRVVSLSRRDRLVRGAPVRRSGDPSSRLRASSAGLPRRDQGKPTDRECNGSSGPTIRSDGNAVGVGRSPGWRVGPCGRGTGCRTWFRPRWSRG